MRLKMPYFVFLEPWRLAPLLLACAIVYLLHLRAAEVGRVLRTPRMGPA